MPYEAPRRKLALSRRRWWLAGTRTVGQDPELPKRQPSPSSQGAVPGEGPVAVRGKRLPQKGRLQPRRRSSLRRPSQGQLDSAKRRRSRRANWQRLPTRARRLRGQPRLKGRPRSRSPGRFARTARTCGVACVSARPGRASSRRRTTCSTSSSERIEIENWIARLTPHEWDSRANRARDVRRHYQGLCPSQLRR